MPVGTEGIVEEEREKKDVERRTGANKFLAEMMGGMGQQQPQQQAVNQ